MPPQASKTTSEHAIPIASNRCRRDRRGLAGSGSTRSSDHSLASELDRYVAALGAPMLVVAVAIGLNMAAGAPPPSIDQFQPGYAAVDFWPRHGESHRGPLGEEPGWRGFAVPRLQSRWSPLASAALLGLLITDGTARFSCRSSTLGCLISRRPYWSPSGTPGCLTGLAAACC